MQLAFIVGTGRCGSTLLHEIFAKHADTSFISAIEENRPRLARLHTLANAIYRAEHNPIVKALGIAEDFIPTEGYALIDRKVSPIYSRPFRDLVVDDVTPWLEKRFRDFFGARYESCGLPVLLHKYTGWSRLGFFSTIFPEARFLHVIRDGRAVASSWQQMRWWNGYEGTSKWLWGLLDEDQQARWEDSNRAFPVLAALGWEKLLNSYVEAEAVMAPDRYLKLRYEDFLEDPAEHCRKILDFFGLSFTQDFQRQLDTFNINASRKAAYERDLLPQQVRAIETAIGPVLALNGYRV